MEVPSGDATRALEGPDWRWTSPPAARYHRPVIYRSGPYELDTDLFELRKSGRRTPLEPQVFDVLSYLIENRSRVVPKEELFEKVWVDRIVSDAALSSRMMAARKAIGDNGRDQKMIRTVHGRGFQFVGAIQAAEGGKPPASAVVAVPATTGPVPPQAGRSLPIGRESELAALRDALQGALAGQRQMVFLTGDAGIGKTTLIETFLSEIAARGDVLLGKGHCVDQLGAHEPYLAVLDALGQIGEGRDGSVLVSVLSRRAPTWLLQLSWLVEDDELAALRERTVGAGQQRMLREIAVALDALSKQRAVVLVLEDLHWADTSTVDLLSMLARRTDAARLLVIGTVRPPSAGSRANPIHDVLSEFETRGFARIIPVRPLSEDDITTYLAERFSVAPAPRGLAALLVGRTRGNPLFLEKVVEEWIENETLVQDDGSWTLSQELETLGEAVPKSLRQMLELNIRSLSERQQKLLEAASIVGRSFSAFDVAAAMNEPDEVIEPELKALCRTASFVEETGSVPRPGGQVTERFSFTHELYPAVLRSSLPATERSRLHERIGLILEEEYLGDLAEHASELAWHFDECGDVPRTLRYSRMAADHALRRSAPRETISYLQRALSVLDRLPSERERDEHELEIQSKLAPTLLASQGFRSRPAEESFRRGIELSTKLEEPPPRSSLIFGLAAMHEFRGDFEQTEALLTQHVDEPKAEMVPESHDLLACSLFHQGRFDNALHHAQRGLEIFDPQGDATNLASLGDDPIVALTQWAALALWFMGKPDTALQRMNRALERSESRRYSLPAGLGQSAILRQFRRERRQTLELADRLLEVSEEQGVPLRVAHAKLLRGWAIALEDDTEDGLSLLREGIAECHSLGAELDRPYYLALQGEALLAARQVSRATDSVVEGIELSARTASYFYAPELYRLRAQMLLAADPEGNRDEAMSWLDRAAQKADGCGARSLALRIATSRVEWGREGDREPARAALAELLDSFDEGRETPDQVAAREAILDD